MSPVIFMKARQYKKLCKKAAQAINFRSCYVEDGIYYVVWSRDCYDSEMDSEDAWPFLVGRFDGDVNTVVDVDSDCGVSYKPVNQILKSTPKNVLSWAKARSK